MKTGCIKNKLLLLVSMLILSASSLRAADESYANWTVGKINPGDNLTVIDDKFLNLSLVDWNLVHNLSVRNSITFELLQNTGIPFYNKTFTCTLDVSIRYFTSRDQQNASEINNVKLEIRYDANTGSVNTVNAAYVFKDAFKVTVIVNSITSTELGANLPDIFRIKNQIYVQRQYPFSANLAIPVEVIPQNASTTQANNWVNISWNDSQFGKGTEEYDIEWIFIDDMSERANTIKTNPASVTDAVLDEWMRNDNSRVTTKTVPYLLNLAYPTGYIIARVRGVSYEVTTGIRRVSNWQYRKNGNLAIYKITDNDVAESNLSNLNWQYNVSYAEEGKRKEVISYFDGSLRNRQTVTLSHNNPDKNNNDKYAVVAETVYDKMGRAAMSILPAPIADTRLKFYPGVNRNTAGAFYSHNDILFNNCTIGAAPLSSVAPAPNSPAGAGQYYSANNAFLNDPNYYFTKYVPNAGGYPFSVTEYTPDNTGRIRRQGGVGSTFQIGKADADGTEHDTKYFYGKPLQTELDRLFGVEVGNASHYLKNMVIDPNGQISVSYVNSAGQTIATALAGKAPSYTDALPSSSSAEAKTNISQKLMRPSDFTVDAGSLSKQATATFLAAVRGDFSVLYTINPVALGPWNSKQPGQQFCNTCYYNIEITAKDDCGKVLGTPVHTSAFQMNDFLCNPNAQPFTGTLNFPVEKFGEHTITYTLKLSDDVIKAQTDYYIKNNADLKTLQTFFHEELLSPDLQASLKACYSECTTCKDKLGSPVQFAQRMNELLQKLKEEKYAGYEFDFNSQQIQGWITTTYQSLLDNCTTLSLSCLPPSPCEQSLDMMKNDVRPGGQYALYDVSTYTVTTQERLVSIFYNKNGAALSYKNDPGISNFEFNDDNGTLRHIKDADVTEAEFIKAYIEHPEWADDFVKRHIEYCSYLWCKDSGNANLAKNNEMSYRFDEKLRNITKGIDAVNGNYFISAGAGNATGYLALSDVDPFFNGGRGSTYKTQFQNDLAALSDVLGIRPKDRNNNFMPAKNIYQLVDWMLYCQLDFTSSTTADEYENSWKNCTPANNCRSITSEWELYRNYYLQLKSKYVHRAKIVYNPSCANCFIGPDPMSQSICDPGPLSDYTLIPDGIRKYRIVYKNGTLPFGSNYKVTLGDTRGQTTTVDLVAGSFQSDVIFPSYNDLPYTLVSIECKNQVLNTCK
jgi:hypothetical protein